MHPQTEAFLKQIQQEQDDERIGVEVPDLAPPPVDGQSGVAIEGDDDFLPLFEDLNNSYDLKEQAYQDKLRGTRRRPGDVSNQFLKPNQKTVMGIDVATGQRVLNRGDFNNAEAASHYTEGVKQLRGATLNAQDGYDMEGVTGASRIAAGVIAQGGTSADFDRAMDMMNMPEWQRRTAWNAASGAAIADQVEAALTEPYSPEEEAEVPADPLPDMSREQMTEDAGWQAAARKLYEAERGEEFGGSNDELMDFFVDEFTNFNWKMAHIPGVNSSSMAYYASRAVTQGEEYAKNFLDLMDYYDRLETDWALAADAFTDLFADPTTYIGLGGGAIAMKVMGRVAKNRLRQGISRYIAQGAGAGMVEGAVYGGIDSVQRQRVEIAANERENIDPGQVAASSGLGAVAGGVLGGGLGAALSPEALKMYRRAAVQMARNAKAPASYTPLSRQRGSVGFKSDNPVNSAATLENAYELVRNGQFKNNLELKSALQAMTQAAGKRAGLNLAKEGDPKVDDAIVGLLTDDARVALASNANAVGWYDETVGAAMKVLELIHPEIGADENARFAFTAALANTSNGLKVDKNFELANKAYEVFKETGKFPTNIGIGNARGAINKTFKLLNDMIETGGIKSAMELFDDSYTVKQLKRLGFDVSGELTTEVVRGAAIMGPKIGNGFYSNLRGKFDQLTMDRWFVRTWGRLTGTLITPRPDMVRAKTAELQGLVAKAKKDPAIRAAFRSIGVDLNGSMKRIANQVLRSSTKPENREVMNSSEVGEGIRTVGNNLAKWIDGQKEAPANGSERARIRALTGRVLDNLRADNPDLTMSDLQAVLWYAEKRLYEVAKTADDDVAGYADDEAPDYANAAAGLAKALGFDDDAIKGADADGRAAGTRRGNQPDGGEGGNPGSEGAGSGARRERRKLLEQRIYAPGRGRFRGDAKASQAYRGKSSRDDRSVRGIVARYEPKQAYQSLLQDAEFPSYSFIELAPERAPDFHKAISGAKTDNKFGAAVYVYDLDDYSGMRTFMTEDGRNGFAIKEDGDIVSVFSAGGGSVHSMLQLAIDQGGRKLDCFDTVLPELYSKSGFKEVGREPWNEEFAPPDWDKELFAPFNDGEPDIVYMEYSDDG